MFRRASSFVMPTDAEKATRAHEKRVAAKKAEVEKQARLADRRASICNAAHNILPRFDKPDLPDTPLLGPVSHTSSRSDDNKAVPIEDEKTYETPFKGAKRFNPLNEKKLQLKAEEHRRIAEISAEQNVNRSQAKVILAQTLKLQRPSSPRSISSDSSRSYVPSMSSPLSSSFTEREGYISHVPLTSIPNDASFKAQKMMGIPQSATVHKSKSERAAQQAGLQRAQSYGSPEGQGQLVTATRVPLQRNLSSTMSVDTTLVRPRHQLMRHDTGATYMSTYSLAPTVDTFGGGESLYTASIYSPVVHFQEPDPDPEPRESGDRTPRMMKASFANSVPIPHTAPLVPKPRKASVVDVPIVNESLLYDVAQRA